jgi:hypothetical protein
LNCGGHAFPTDGFLLGPILEEFRKNRDDLCVQLNEIYKKALAKRGLGETGNFPIKISVQGGVGTAQEHKFLLDYYGADSVGWGSTFLLVPETTNVDCKTLQQLQDAEEDDYYLSTISPLGIPFNNLRNNSKDREKEDFIARGTPGSLCPKDHLALNSEFGERTLCTASRRYQTQKIEEIMLSDLSQAQKDEEIRIVKDKACICVGLGTAALINNNLDNRIEGMGVSICPGPSLVSFDRTYTLKEMVDHIYGRTDLLVGTQRLHFFIRELKMYADYLSKNTVGADYKKNMLDGIEYYLSLFPDIEDLPEDVRKKSLEVCQEIKECLI